MLESISKNIKLQYFLLFTIAILVYSNTINHSYTWDDALVIQQNEYTKAGFSGLKDIWTKKVFLHNRNVYRPVPQSVYAITYQIAPNNSTVAHIVNILFYAIAVVVTFWFLILLFYKENKWLLFFISLLFAFHPVHTEVVANIKSLDEILAYLFGILSLIFYLKFLKKINILFLFIAIIFLGIAILSKINAITFLVVFLLLHWFHYKDSQNLYRKINLFIKGVFFEKELSNKAVSFILLIIAITLYVFTKKQLYLFVIPILVLLASLIFKSNHKVFNILLFILITITLVGFNLQISLIIFSVLITYYLLEKEKSLVLYFSIFSFIFISAFSIINVDYGPTILAILFSITSILLILKKNKVAVIFLSIITCIALFIEIKISSTTLSLLLLIVFCLFYRKFNFKIVFFILFTTSVLLDSFYLKKYNFIQKNNTSNQIIHIENNQDVSIGMTILHNTLWHENNAEIKFATIAKIQLKYLQLLVYPHPLVHQYGFNQITKTNFKDWKVWFSIITHLALFLFALYKLKDKSPISFGILLYLATISIYTNIVILMPDTLAERFLFSPSLGFLIAFVFAINEFFRMFSIKNINLAISIFFIPILIAFSYKTIDRNKAWKNNFTLAKNTIKYAPNNAAINAQYATELNLKNGDSTLIIKHYQKAIEIHPEFYSATKDLATYYISLKQPKKAEKLFQKCIDLNPLDWETNYFLAFINYEKKDYFKAISYFQQALYDNDKKVGMEKYIYSSEFLARCFFNTNQIPLADKILKDNYTQYKAKSSIVLLGNIYHQSGNTSKSLETYSILLKDFPNDQDLLRTIELLKSSL